MLHAATLSTDKKQTQHQIIIFKLHCLDIILFLQKKLSRSFNGSSILLNLTPVARSIFGLLSQTHFSKSEFKNEILRCALLDIQMTLLCVCGVDSFIPELEHLIKKLFHGLCSEKNPLKSDSWIQIHEMKLRSTSSAEENFADEITWIT